MTHSTTTDPNPKANPKGNPNPSPNPDDEVLNEPGDELPAPDAHPSNGGAGLLFWLFLAVIVLPVLIFTSWGERLINGLGAGDQREYLGTVQKISYIGGLGSNTQVDTETRTLLLRGPVILTQGTALERRILNFTSDVCVVKTDQCWHLMGS